MRGPAETGIAEPRVVHDVLCAMMQQSEAQGEFWVQQFDNNITSIRRKAPFKLQVLCGVDYLFKDLVLTAIGEGRTLSISFLRTSQPKRKSNYYSNR